MAAVGEGRWRKAKDIRREPQQDSSHYRSCCAVFWCVDSSTRYRSLRMTGGIDNYLLGCHPERSIEDAQSKGNEGSAASGRRSDLSEWQRSARDDGEKPRTFAGNRNRILRTIVLAVQYFGAWILRLPLVAQNDTFFRWCILKFVRNADTIIVNYPFSIDN